MATDNYLVIGLMSGTSMDGVDAVLLETDGKFYVKIHDTTSLIYPTHFIQTLKNTEQQLKNLSIINLPDLSEITVQSTAYHQQAIKQLLSNSHYRAQDIQYIGYHGQTLLHRPHEKFSLQIGNPQQLANYFHIPVIFNFRQQDLAAGGQGAPLIPLYHQVLMQKKQWANCVIINCGGIANMSVIRGLNEEDIESGFDTGPGNILLDRLVREWTNGTSLFDKNGRYALAGKINPSLLKKLFTQSALTADRKNYYDLPPPKSLDSKDIEFIEDIYQNFSPSKNPQKQLSLLQNGCATLAAFTAYSIAYGCHFIQPPIPHQWIIAGGGAKNPAILHYLQNYLHQYDRHIKLQTATEVGFNNQFIEAELMAWLAVRSIKKLPFTLPKTTGVNCPTSGGEIFFPQ